jgi:phage/plasmid primase-like uncharacterized protein
MVAAVTRWPSKLPSAIHRTFLRADGLGKASVEPAKMALGPCAGGAIRLAPPGATLALAEGIETGLAVQQSTGIPTWVTLSASNLPNVILPPLPLTAEIVIAADPDPAGLRAAYAAAEQWSLEGRRVRVAIPPPNMDFNDILQRGAA